MSEEIFDVVNERDEVIGLKVKGPVVKLTAAFEQLGLSPQIRAEKVSLEQFVELTE